MKGGGGNGGERALPPGTAASVTVTSQAPRVANGAGITFAPSETDMRGGAAAAALAHPGVRVGDAGSMGSSTGASAYAYTGAAVAPSPASFVGYDGAAMPPTASLTAPPPPPMVEFTAPPPPPIFETPHFPFSPSMAMAAGTPPPTSIPGMPGASLQGYSPFGPPAHMMHQQMVPLALSQMRPAEEMGRLPANSLFSAAMVVNENY